jgi:predicted secreted protein
MRLNSYWCWLFFLAIGMTVNAAPIRACAMAPSSGQHYIVVGFADDGKTVHIDTAQVLLICLPTQATGYRWKISEYDSAHWTASELSKEQLKQLDAEGVLHSGPDHGFPGATGLSVFQFKPLSQGITHIDLHYERSWDKKNPAKTFGVTVSVMRGN